MKQIRIISHEDMPNIEQLRTNMLEGRNGELLCRNCNRIGWRHIPFAPFHCKDYETESVLETTFEAKCIIVLEIPCQTPNDS